MKTNNLISTILTPEEMLKHWQGHRRLTCRIIGAFPEEEFFNHSIGVFLGAGLSADLSGFNNLTGLFLFLQGH